MMNFAVFKKVIGKEHYQSPMTNYLAIIYQI
jgi:hypothetical protein